MNAHHGRCGGVDTGAALVDLLLATTMIALLAGMATPLTIRATDAGRVRAAAGYLAGRLRLARVQAVRTGAATAILFDATDDWSFRLCRDGNGNGVRRADVDSGDDACAPRERLGDRFAGVSLALDPAVPDLDAVTGRLDGVRFGRSAMASCSPVGHCTPGSLYLQSAGAIHYAVRVSAMAGRTRFLRFDPGASAWGPG